MRLRALHLDRFGHFTDRKYDFGAAGARPDFHIIYGPNEAGKTTTMEAALRLFYGFPLREPYAFKHQRANLQVSGVLEIDGQPRHVTRLPKRLGALLDEGGTPLPEAALTAHLGGLTEEDYRNLLCLDDDTLERGGEEIAQARGDIGKLLFSAAAGVADLSTVLDAVRNEADEIWRKRATKTRVAELKRELTQLEKDMRTHDISASAWRGLKKTLAEATAQEAEARALRDAAHERTAEIAAQRRALPRLGEIDDLAARIAPFAAYPQQLDFDPETLVGLITDEARAKADLARLTNQINALTAQSEALIRAPGLAAMGQELDALDELRARDVTASMDLERRHALVREAEAAMAHAAHDLGALETCDPRTLVVSPAQLVRMEEARDALRRAQAAAKSETRELADLTESRDDAQADLDRLQSRTPATQGIADMLARHDAEALVPAHATARQAIDTADTAARRALADLAPQADALPPCPTSPTKARAWADADTALREKIAQTQAELANHRADLAAREAQAKVLEDFGHVVTDDTAAGLRADRDRLWQAHLAAMEAQTAQAFEAAMQALDEAQQTRLSHASDLGQLRQITQTASEAKARADAAQARLTEMQEAQEALTPQIAEAAKAVGLSPDISAAEWLDWVTRHATATEAQRNAQEVRAQHQTTLRRAQTLLEALAPHLDLEHVTFDSAIAAARRVAEDERNARSSLTQAQDMVARLDTDLARRQRKHDAACAEAKRAQEAWQALIADALPGSIAADVVLASLEPLRRLRTQDEKRADAAQRVATMQKDQARFATAVEALATAHDLPLADSAAESFALLRDRATAAQKAEESAAALTGETQEARTALTKAQSRLEEIDQKVAIMGRIFPGDVPVDTLDQLRSAATRAQSVIADREAKSAQERALIDDLGASDLTDARAKLVDLNAVSLTAAAETCKADLAEAETRLTEATEARVTAAQALSQVTGNADIAAMAERRATLELELEDAALAHLELSLGHRQADAAIRRYRDSHRSDMMAATEQCFAQLTQGKYARLTTQADGSDETLLAVDGDGTVKRVAEMSKGTRFQLYLALRAAAHEQLIEQGTCLPFFCDDIFETFDEDRTRAACRVMERIGQSGQAIYLTHHRHVVEIARDVCRVAPLIHEI